MTQHNRFMILVASLKSHSSAFLAQSMVIKVDIVVIRIVQSA